MRIGIDIRSLGGKRHSGVEEYIFNLLPQLFRLGKKDRFVLLSNNYKGSLPQNVKDWAKLPNVSLKEYKIPSKILNFLIWQFSWPHLDRMLGKVDVFFSPNITFTTVSRKVPHVITLHDLSFELLPHFFNFYRRLWHFLVNPRKQAKKATKIITVSKSTMEDVREIYKIKRNKIHPIYLGLSNLFLDYKHEKNQEKIIRKRYKIGQKPFILYLGTLEPRKNISSIIQAFNEFKKESKLDYSLVVAGAKGWSFQEIFNLALQSSYKKDIFFTGEIREKDRPTLYEMASLFVFPSFFEGFGFPPMEALSLGKPVICSASTSLLEIFGNHTILINPHDVGELAWTMGRVLNDEKIQDSMKEEGQKYVRKFSWEKTAKKTLAVIHEAGRR